MYVARGFLSSVLLLSTIFFWIGYFRLHEGVERVTFGAMATAMNREVGRRDTCSVVARHVLLFRAFVCEGSGKYGRQRSMTCRSCHSIPVVLILVRSGFCWSGEAWAVEKVVFFWALLRKDETCGDHHC